MTAYYPLLYISTCGWDAGEAGRQADRVRVEDDGVVRIALADGAVLTVKPVVVDVIKDADETNYFVQGAMQVIIEQPAGEKP